MAISEDIKHDAGLVDAFLHPVDRAYTIEECFSFLERAGLRFQAWADPLEHSPRVLLASSHPLFDRINALPPRLRAQAVDLLSHYRGNHSFLACHPERIGTDLDFGSEVFMNYVPELRAGLSIAEARNAAGEATINLDRRGYHFELSRIASLIMAEVDGHKTCLEITRRSCASEEDLSKYTEFARVTFAEMHDLGHLLFRTPRA